MNKVFRLLTNKFLITGVVFAVWMLYFDQNDWFSMQRRKKELQDTRDNIAYLNKEIAQMEKDKEGMLSDPKVLEKYAREQFHMKRDTEDLYIIEQ